MGRWGDGEIGEIFIKGNYPDMILTFSLTALLLWFFKTFYTKVPVKKIIKLTVQAIQRCDPWRI
ncbi:MAG: hypothetical protein F6J90_09230 [Moorea sp. SIOASIH]|uniref:hypothetical protein n=1 Tax=Moorena sp. SIOASIH TaxID=2607817 RepID=UPI0013B7BE49|nr:hypothetical protein [Moorena sp. SIOASIH]NEO36495.1 hypothetical protein [Moorena sp. SIOASIH]